jgi:mannose-6-phosphate isomerase-like protein (cupin superfamily)
LDVCHAHACHRHAFSWSHTLLFRKLSLQEKIFLEKQSLFCYHLIAMQTPIKKQPLVRHRDETPAADWPFGEMRRIVTAGQGGVANIHVAKVRSLPPFFHTGYDEIYYILSGSGTVTLDGQSTPVRPGSVVVIPTGTKHSLQAADNQELEILIVGTPPISIEDDRAKPKS